MVCPKHNRINRPHGDTRPDAGHTSTGVGSLFAHPRLPQIVGGRCAPLENEMATNDGDTVHAWRRWHRRLMKVLGCTRVNRSKTLEAARSLKARYEADVLQRCGTHNFELADGTRTAELEEMKRLRDESDAAEAEVTKAFNRACGASGDWTLGMLKLIQRRDTSISALIAVANKVVAFGQADLALDDTDSHDQAGDMGFIDRHVDTYKDLKATARALAEAVKGE